MRVRDGMTTLVLTVGPSHTIRQVAARMADRNVGAAVVLDPDAQGYGILTERDVLLSVAAGEDPDVQRVADHLSSDLTCAAPDWSLERAAETMVRAGFRHLLVVDHGEPVGVLSMRDVVRCWTESGAVREEDPSAAASAGAAA